MSDEKKVFKDLPKFTVKRSEWLRGEGSNESGLLCNGRLCCLGFYSRALGFSDLDLREATAPSMLIDNLGVKFDSKLLENDRLLYGVDTKESTYLMTVNDNPDLEDQKREEILTQKFAELGIEVEFVD